MKQMADITELLSSSDPDALDRALPLIYDVLSDIASGYLRQERADHTMETGDLVHEVYSRLRGQSDADYHSRKHFLVVAANAMRRLLVDYSRRHNADKRTPGQQLTITLPALDEKAFDVMDLDAALTKLETLDQEMAVIVKLRYFAGLPAHEIGDVLDLSSMAVSRRWWQARQWLKRELAA